MNNIEQNKVSQKQNKTIQSPCISNCCLDEKDICLGCFRHVDEVTAWHSADSNRRLEILNNCKERRENR